MARTSNIKLRTVGATEANRLKSYQMFQWRLKVEGTLAYGEMEELLFGVAANGDNADNTAPELEIPSTGSLTIGQYPRDTDASVAQWHCIHTTKSGRPAAGHASQNTNFALDVNGTYRQGGGICTWAGPVWLRALSHVSLSDCTWVGFGATPKSGGTTGNDDVWRIRQYSDDLVINNMLITGKIRFDFFKAATINGLRAEYIPSAGIQCLAGLTGADNNAIFDFRDYSSKGLTFDCDAYGGARVRFINLAEAAEIKVTHNARTNGVSFHAVTEVQKEIKFKVLDSQGQPVEHARIYIKDHNNSNRPATDATWRSGATASYTADREYFATTDADGNTNMLTLLTRAIYEGQSLHGVYQRTRNGWRGTAASKIDYRSKNNSYDDIFEAHVWAYGYQYRKVEFAANGAGVKTITVELLPDTNITETDRSLVAAYTDFTLTTSASPHIIGLQGATVSLDKLYDWLQFLKSSSNTHIKLPSVQTAFATRDGSILDAGGHTITIDGGTMNPGSKFKTIKTTHTYNEINGGVGNTGVISSAGVRLLLTVNAQNAKCAISDGTNITYHTLPAKPTVPVGSTISVLAKADKHIYQRYENIDTDAQTTLDIRLPPDAALDDDTFTADELSKFTLRDSTDEDEPVVPANQIYICVDDIDLYAQRGKSKNLIDRFMRENKFLKFLLEYTDELSGSPLSGSAILFSTDRVSMDTTKIGWHKTSLLTERSRIGVPIWTAGDMAYQAPRGDTGEVIFDSLSTIADVDSATLAEVVSATAQDMTVSGAIANAVWGVLTSALNTPSTIGKHLAELTGGGGGGGTSPTAIWNHLVADAQVEGSLGKHLGDLMSGGGGGTTITETVRNQIAASVWTFISGQAVHDNLVTLLQRWDARTIEELTQAAKMQIPIGSIPFTTGTYATGYIMHDGLLSLVLASPQSDDVVAKCIHTVDGAPADNITYFTNPAHTIVSVCSNDTHNYFLVRRDSDGARSLTAYHRASDTADHTPTIATHLSVTPGTQSLVSIDGHLTYGIQTSGDLLAFRWLRGEIAQTHTTEIPYVDGQSLSLAYTDGQLYAQHDGKMYVFTVQFDEGGISGITHKYTHDVAGQIVVPLHHSVFMYDNDGHIYPLNADFSRITAQWDAVTLRDIRADVAAAHTTTDGKIGEVKQVVDALPSKTQIGEEIRDNIDFDDADDTTTSLKQTFIAISQDLSVIQQLLSKDAYRGADTILKQVKNIKEVVDSNAGKLDTIDSEIETIDSVADTIELNLRIIEEYLTEDTAPTSTSFTADTIFKRIKDMKLQIDKFRFTNNDVKATLDGETVTTDTASRAAITDAISSMAALMPAAVWNYHIDNYFHITGDDDAESAVSPTIGRHLWEMWEWAVTLFNDLRTDGNNFAQSPTLLQKINAIKERTDKMQYRSEENDDVEGREQLHTYTDVDVTLPDDTTVHVNLTTVETMCEKILNQLTVDAVNLQGLVKSNPDKNTEATLFKRFKDEITRQTDLDESDIEQDGSFINIKKHGTDEIILRFKNRGSAGKIDWTAGRMWTADRP